MIDLTPKFDLAIAIKNVSFDESKWYSSLDILVKESILSFLWDDIDDNWIIMGRGSERTLMAARHFPLVFINDPVLEKKIGDIFSDRFIAEFVSNFDDEAFCLKKEKIYSYFPWDTDAVSPDNFSLEDLFYATH
jgi:hypothetical protein